MQKKAAVKIIIFISIAILFAGLCVLTFVDIKSFRKVYFTVNYETTEGGKIDGSIQQSVQKGRNAETVTAVPDEGYRFIGWADGVATAKRVDKNIQSDMEVTAYFEPNIYSITYLATEGGHIEGQTNQITYGDRPFETVKAVADEGYRFVGWDDDTPELDSRFHTRTDSVHGGNIELFENNNSITVTAIFEKVN